MSPRLTVSIKIKHYHLGKDIFLPCRFAGPANSNSTSGLSSWWPIETAIHLWESSSHALSPACGWRLRAPNLALDIDPNENKLPVLIKTKSRVIRAHRNISATGHFMVGNRRGIGAAAGALCVVFGVCTNTCVRWYVHGCTCERLIICGLVTRWQSFIWSITAISIITHWNNNWDIILYGFAHIEDNSDQPLPPPRLPFCSGRSIILVILTFF